MKKFILPIAGAACLILSGCNGSDLPANSLEYIAVQMEEDGKWGFVNKDGEMKYAEEFKNQPTAIANGFFSVEENEGYTLYKAGEKPEAVKGCDDLKNVGYMMDGLIPVVKKHSRIALVNGNGETQFTLDPIKGKEVTSCYAGFSDGMLRIMIEGDKFGYVNTSGKVIVNPEYDFGADFSEGLAVVAKNDHYVVIDKKGETKFKLNKNWSLHSFMYHYGVIVAEDANERVLFVDTKGEVEKCPAKVKAVMDYNTDYYVFSDGDAVGVMSRKKNEVIIRPKYEHIEITDEGKFVCNDEKAIVWFDTKGEKLFSTDDYQGFIYVQNFGIIAADKKTGVLLDKEGKTVKNCEFYDYNADISPTNGIYSDYFSAEGFAETVASKITTDGYASLKLGAFPGTIFSDPKEYEYKSDAEVENLKVDGWRFSLNVAVGFESTMAESTYKYDDDSYSGEWKYSWVKTPLNQIQIQVNADVEIDVTVLKAVVNAIEKKGYTLYASNYKADEKAAILNSKNATIAVGLTGDNGIVINIVKRLDDARLKSIKTQLETGTSSADINEVSDEDEYLRAREKAETMEQVEVVEEDY